MPVRESHDVKLTNLTRSLTPSSHCSSLTYSFPSAVPSAEHVDSRSTNQSIMEANQLLPSGSSGNFKIPKFPFCFRPLRCCACDRFRAHFDPSAPCIRRGHVSNTERNTKPLYEEIIEAVPLRKLYNMRHTMTTL